MFILTKRSAPSDGGFHMHAIYGITYHVGEARAWFRASRVTDVIEIHYGPQALPTGFEGNGFQSYISSTRLSSWREEQAATENLLAVVKKEKT